MKRLRKYMPGFATIPGILALLGTFVIAPAALAQMAGGQNQQAPPTVAGAVRNFYNGIKNNIIHRWWGHILGAAEPAKRLEAPVRALKGYMFDEPSRMI